MKLNQLCRHITGLVLLARRPDLLQGIIRSHQATVNPPEVTKWINVRREFPEPGDWAMDNEQMLNTAQDMHTLVVIQCPYEIMDYFRNMAHTAVSIENVAIIAALPSGRYQLFDEELNAIEES